MKNRQARYQSVIGIVLAMTFFCVITLAVVIVASMLRQQNVPDDESMGIDFSLCPLCDQPTGFITKPPTIRDDR
jgi:hypothetical protein